MLHNLFRRINQLETNYQITFSLIVGVAVVAFWRGVWQLFDHYLFAESFVLSAYASLIVGILLLLGTNALIRKLL